MGLRGRAFNAMWSNLLPGYARELDRWHTIEHMPERLGVPGFLRGRRYINAVASDHSLFILYEAAHIETFRSPGLIARLNDPTEWSKKVQPGLLNFTRGPCQTLISLGEGVGGAILTIRLSGKAQSGAQVGDELTDLAPALTRLHGVTAVHIGRHVPDDIVSAEKKLRPTTATPSFGFVILVEGLGAAELEAAQPDIVKIAARSTASALELGVFRLAYLLDHAG